MSELLIVKNLFVCAYEKSSEELKKNIVNILTTKENDYKGNKAKKVVILDSEGEEESEDGKEENKEKQVNMHNGNEPSKYEKKKKIYDEIRHYLDGNRNNVLHFAIYGNNFENVKFLIENTDLINSYNDDGQNGLIISILNNNEEISKYLLENNINYNIIDKHGSNPLLYSLITHNYEIFNILIEKKDIDININSREKGNLIGICVFEKNIKILKKLFNKNISPDCAVNIYPHPLIFILHNNDNNLLYLYLTYALYYCTSNEELRKVNDVNFNEEEEEIIINLNKKDFINFILKDPKYDLTIFKKILNLRDEDQSTLLDICKVNGNEAGEEIILYYSFV